MRITQLNAGMLSILGELQEAQEVTECASWWPDIDLVAVPVRHRALDYMVGRWCGWEGNYWVLELRTGIIFRGSLGYIKEVIRVCSGAYHEPHGFRRTAPRAMQ